MSTSSQKMPFCITCHQPLPEGHKPVEYFAKAWDIEAPDDVHGHFEDLSKVLLFAKAVSDALQAIEFQIEMGKMRRTEMAEHTEEYLSWLVIAHTFSKNLVLSAPS